MREGAFIAVIWLFAFLGGFASGGAYQWLREGFCQ